MSDLALALAETGSLEPLRELAAKATELAAKARAPNTVRAYEAGWSQWGAWCKRHGQCPSPADPAALALWVTELAEAGRTPATIRLRLGAVGRVHTRANRPDPTRAAIVQEVAAGIGREWRKAKTERQVAPLTWDLLCRAVDAIPGPSRRGARDRAVLLLGFGAALRRSEIAALRVEDVRVTPEGLRIAIRRSKTDQEGLGAELAVPRAADETHCPVRAIEAWLPHVEPGGSLFPGVGGRTIARIVQAAVARIGEDPTEYSGHSLRAGLATSAARAGASDQSIMRQGRWRSRATMDRYTRERDRWRDNAATAAYGKGGKE